MAIKLIANYSKRLGLPGYSSHQYSVSIETELTAADQIEEASRHLYQQLQSNVDEQILQTGFVPPMDYGMEPAGEGESVPPTAFHPSGNWKCTTKQKELILRIIDEQQLDKNWVEELANQRFGKGVRLLERNEASGLIDELLGKPVKTTGGYGRYSGYGKPNPRRIA